MTDRELMVMAAKAAGLPASSATWSDFDWDVYGWSPLTDDGDAMRLAVKLRINVVHFPVDVAAMLPDAGKSWAERYRDDPCAATRRAIVRAAAAMSEELK